ncbi:immunoglobulin-like and fibronectin type III domain-containing protein 1 [Trichomycterus rosablanca]|uniref:immunoglobulin-like and fibronectin type III domain-containing protein 1 n=1 Tax=Trichomycterus rosablanca TaxID=2290929 RepID=UPI002F357A48
MLKKTVIVKKRKEEPKKEGEIDPKFWEMLISAQKKDYERICREYGITDFRWMLKRLNQMKKEREDEQAKVVEDVENLKHIELNPHGNAEFELDMKLKDPNNKIYLYKDGKMIDYGDGTDDSCKHIIKKDRNKYKFSITNVGPEDAGLYQVDVEDTNVFSSGLEIPDVEFGAVLKDANVVEGQDAAFECVLSAPVKKLSWYYGDTSIENDDKYNIKVSEDMLTHSLVVRNCKPKDKGIYTVIAGTKMSKAALSVNEPQAYFLSGLSDTSANVGKTAELSCTLSSEDIVGIWYKDGKKLESNDGITIIKDGATHKLIIKNCQEENAGTYRFEANGRKSEAALSIEDPPNISADALGKFSEPVIVKAGENAVFKLPFSGKEPLKVQWFKDDDELLNGPNVKTESSFTQSRLLLTKCQRKDTGEVKIKIKNEFATIEATSKLIVLAFPGQPACPKVISAFKDCINLSWIAPPNTGGGSIIGYNLEKRKKGSNLWSQVNPKDEPIREKKYAVKDVMEGGEYEFRVIAINACGPGEPSAPSDSVFARDPQKPPGLVKDLKPTGSSYTSLCLAWTKPNVIKGIEDEAKGYFVEIRPVDQLDWSRCNTNATIKTSFTVAGLKSLAKYWVRVIATNEGGEGLPQAFDKYVIAMPPPVKPKFTDRKMKNFMVVKAGDTVRVSIRFEASPWPDITWLKDGVPVSKHVTVTNSDKGSQLLIPTSERSDSGLYTIIVKNLVGQDTFSVEIRVTDNPKPPGPVELEQNVRDTVTLSWIPSPDEKLDDRLHYMVMKRDSVKQTWRTVADNLFNYKFTINIIQGREYNFRVFAKNDMGLSEPSVSPTWGTVKKKGMIEVNRSESKNLDFQSAPRFTVPLKLHTAPKGYECYMSCAVRGNPAPHITWYHNNVSLNTDTNYYISNTCGVCSLLILMVGPKNTGEYKVVAENPLGQAESSTNFTVRE